MRVFGVSGGARGFVDQAAEDGFAVDPFAVEVGNGEVATVVFAVRDALGDALVRPGRVVTRLLFGQGAAQVALAEDQHAVQEHKPGVDKKIPATVATAMSQLQTCPSGPDTLVLAYY